MLYVFHGTDAHTIANKANGLVATLKKRKPDALVFTFEETNIDPVALDELIEAQGLFVEKHIVHVKTSFETRAHQDPILERLERFATSSNVVVLSLGKLLAEHKRTIEKHAEKIEEHTVVRERNEYNVFALGDALGARNPRGLWMHYTLARRSGVAPQALHGTLMWAVRSMVLASRNATATDADQKPNVYSKFKRYAQNYSEDELRELPRALIRLYHDAFRGRHDLDTALERWTLTV
jgi:DNA polymerase III delta subunit